VGVIFSQVSPDIPQQVVDLIDQPVSGYNTVLKVENIFFHNLWSLTFLENWCILCLGLELNLSHEKRLMVCFHVYPHLNLNVDVQYQRSAL